MIRREGERLRRRREHLEATFDQLRARFPSAEILAEEIQATSERDRRFIEGLSDAAKRLQKLQDQVAEAVEAARSDGAITVEFCWSAGEAKLSVREKGSNWQRGSRRQIDVDAAAEAILHIDGEGGEVVYPIIFTHQALEHQRALAYALCCAAIMVAAKRAIDEEEGLQQIDIQGVDGGRRLRATDQLFADQVPTARAFGFTEESELTRRMSDFAQTNAQAHRIDWIQGRKTAPQELMLLREPRGSLLQLEVDRRLGRIRCIERPTSEVTRKRKNIFVDLRPLEVEDRYFADDEALSSALDELLWERVERGYRLGYERVGSGEEMRERGRRPSSFLRWP